MYFSNGTEGEMFYERNCARCIHDTEQGCPVWALHLLWNYDAVGRDADQDKRMALDMFIPRDDPTVATCNMLVLLEEKTRED